MIWKHSDEQLAQSIAQYHSKHPCTKNYGADDACKKGIGSQMFDKIRTPQICYECVRADMEEYKREKENNNGQRAITTV